MAAPLGNKNAAKAKEWEQALKRAMAQIAGGELDFRHTLQRIAHSVVMQALDGNVNAWREVAERMDGKPAQTVTGEIDGEPIKITIQWQNNAS